MSLNTRFLMLCWVLVVTSAATFLNPSTIHKVQNDACTTDDKKQGRCVDVSKCSEKTEVDLSKLDVYRMSTCHYLEKCCAIENILTTTEKPTTKNEKPDGCGYSYPSPFSFMKKSTMYADFGEYPWMVALLTKNHEDWKKSNYMGSGSLINGNVVMTAAHKVHQLQANQLKCRAGEWDTRTIKEVYPYQEREVQTIVLHPDFNRRELKNNIALLIMVSPFDISVPHVGSACLEKELPPPGTNCYSMGWGQKVFDKEEYAIILKKISSPVLDKSVCENSFRPIVGSTYKMDDSMMCAGAVHGLSSCMGDGGSPLICPIPSSEGPRYSVVGMVVMGYKCGIKGTPVAFTNLPHLYNWVLDTMRSHGYETKSFVY